MLVTIHIHQCNNVLQAFFVVVSALLNWCLHALRTRMSSFRLLTRSHLGRVSAAQTAQIAHHWQSQVSLRLRPQHLLPGSRSHKDGLASPDPAREVFVHVFNIGLRKRHDQNAIQSTSPRAKPLTALNSLAKLYERFCIACSTILLSWFVPMVIGCLQGQAPRMADMKCLDKS